MAAVFAEGPLTAWVFSPLFHRDPVHFLANVGAILLFGRAIETYFTPRRYALFVLGAAAASTLGAVAVLAAFAPPPHAAYGASGIAFALTGYGIRFLRADERSAVEELLAPFAVVALLFVCYDVASGPYFEPGWFNGAHAVGWIAGGATGLSR
jgi:membrane associated rhomboid family serine protease